MQELSFNLETCTEKFESRLLYNAQGVPAAVITFDSRRLSVESLPGGITLGTLIIKGSSELLDSIIIKINGNVRLQSPIELSWFEVNAIHFVNEQPIYSHVIYLNLKENALLRSSLRGEFLNVQANYIEVRSPVKMQDKISMATREGDLMITGPLTAGERIKLSSMKSLILESSVRSKETILLSANESISVVAKILVLALKVLKIKASRLHQNENSMLHVKKGSCILDVKEWKSEKYSCALAKKFKYKGISAKIYGSIETTEALFLEAQEELSIYGSLRGLSGVYLIKSEKFICFRDASIELNHTSKVFLSHIDVEFFGAADKSLFILSAEATILLLSFAFNAKKSVVYGANLQLQNVRMHGNTWEQMSRSEDRAKILLKDSCCLYKKFTAQQGSIRAKNSFFDVEILELSCSSDFEKSEFKIKGNAKFDMLTKINASNVSAKKLYFDGQIVISGDSIFKADKLKILESAQILAEKFICQARSAKFSGYIETKTECTLEISADLKICGSMKGIGGICQIQTKEFIFEAGVSVELTHTDASRKSYIHTQIFKCKDKSKFLLKKEQVQLAGDTISDDSEKDFIFFAKKTVIYGASFHAYSTQLSGDSWFQDKNSSDSADVFLKDSISFCKEFTLIQGTFSMEDSWLVAEEPLNFRASDTAKLLVKNSIIKTKILALYCAAEFSHGSTIKADSLVVKNQFFLNCHASIFEVKEDAYFDTDATFSDIQIDAQDIFLHGGLTIKLSSTFKAKESCFIDARSLMAETPIISAQSAVSDKKEYALVVFASIINIQNSNKPLDKPFIIRNVALLSDDLTCIGTLAFVDSYLYTLSKGIGQQLIEGDIRLENTQFVTDGGIFNRRSSTFVLDKKSKIYSDSELGIWNFGRLNSNDSTISAHTFWQEKGVVKTSSSQLNVQSSISINKKATFSLENDSHLLASKAMFFSSGYVELNTKSTAEVNALHLSSGGELKILGEEEKKSLNTGVTIHEKAFISGETELIRGYLIGEKEMCFSGNSRLKESYVRSNTLSFEAKIVLDDTRLEADSLETKKSSISEIKRSAIVMKKISHYGKLSLSGTKTSSIITKELSTHAGSIIQGDEFSLETGSWTHEGTVNCLKSSILTKELSTHADSIIRGHELSLETGDWTHKGTVSCQKVSATGLNLQNAGVVIAKDQLYLGYDRSVINQGRLQSKKLTIDTVILSNVLGGIMDAHVLDTASLLNIDLGGVAMVNHSHKKSLSSLGIELRIPSFTHAEDLYNDFWSLQTLIALGQVSKQLLVLTPAGPVITGLTILTDTYQAGQSLYSLCQSSKRLYELYKSENPNDQRAHRYVRAGMDVLESGYHFAQSARTAVGTYNRAYKDYQKQYSPNFSSSNPSNWHMPENVNEVKQFFSEAAKKYGDNLRKHETSHILKTLAGGCTHILPSSTTFSLGQIDVGLSLTGQSNHVGFMNWNVGANVSINGSVNSFFNLNTGINAAWNSSETSYKSINHGVDLSKQKNLQISSYTNHGLFQTSSGNIEVKKMIYNSGNIRVLGETSIKTKDFSQVGRAYLKETFLDISDSLKFASGTVTTLQDTTIRSLYTDDAGELISRGSNFIETGEYLHTGHWRNGKRHFEKDIFYIKTKKASLKGRSDLNRTGFSIEKMDYAEDFLLGRNSYEKYKISSLQCELKQSVRFKNVGETDRALFIIASDIKVDSEFKSASDLSLIAKDQDVTLNGNISGKKVYLCANRDVEIKGKLLGSSQVGIKSKRDVQIAPQTANTTESSSCNPSEIIAGDGGITIMAEGDFTNDVSTMRSTGINTIEANGGIQFKARTEEVTMNTTKESFWGFSKMVTAVTTSRVITPILEGKKNILCSKNGKVYGEALQIRSEDGNKIHAYKSILIEGKTITHRKSEKTTVFFDLMDWGSETSSTQEEVASQCEGGKTSFFSETGNIHFNGINIDASNLEYEAPRGVVTQDRKILKHSVQVEKNAIQVMAGAVTSFFVGAKVSHANEVHTVETLGAGMVRAQNVVVAAKEFQMNNGAQMEVEKSADLSVKKFNQNAAALKETFEHSELGASLGVSIDSTIFVHVGASDVIEKQETISHEQARLKVAGKLHTDIAEVNQQGGSITADKIEGHIKTFRSKSCQDAQKEYSVDLAADSSGKFSGRVYSHESAKIQETSGLFVKEGLASGDCKLEHVELTAARIVTQEGGELHLKSIKANSLKDIERTDAAYISLNPMELTSIARSDSNAPLFAFPKAGYKHKEREILCQSVIHGTGGLTVKSDHTEGVVYSQDEKGEVIQKEVDYERNVVLPIVNPTKASALLASSGFFSLPQMSHIATKTKTVRFGDEKKLEPDISSSKKFNDPMCVSESAPVKMTNLTEKNKSEAGMVQKEAGMVQKEAKIETIFSEKSVFSYNALNDPETFVNKDSSAEVPSLEDISYIDFSKISKEELKAMADKLLLEDPPYVGRDCPKMSKEELKIMVDNFLDGKLTLSKEINLRYMDRTSQKNTLQHANKCSDEKTIITINRSNALPLSTLDFFTSNLWDYDRPAQFQKIYDHMIPIVDDGTAVELFDAITYAKGREWLDAMSYAEQRLSGVSSKDIRGVFSEPVSRVFKWGGTAAQAYDDLSVEGVTKALANHYVSDSVEGFVFSTALFTLIPNLHPVNKLIFHAGARCLGNDLTNKISGSVAYSFFKTADFIARYEAENDRFFDLSSDDLFNELGKLFDIQKNCNR